MRVVPETRTDHDGLGPVAQGEDWLSVLFREHYRRVLSTAYRITGSAADAEDVLQTVFSRLTTREPGSIPSWGPYLKRAAINAALDVLRARKRDNTTDVDQLLGELTDSEPGPEGVARRSELEARLRAALALESARPAEIFALRCFEGYAYEEIADVLGTSRTVVAVTLHRVRGRLKKTLGDAR